jgi:hypothetical protein
MTQYLSYVKDTIGNNYVGVNIYSDIVYPYIDKMKTILGESADEYIELQKNRDHGKYHITVINVMDYNRLSKELGMDEFVNSLEKAFEYPIDDIQLMGLGTAEKNSNRAYFVVVKSEKLKSIRDRYNLPEQDFHITIGFKYKDVFGVRKNQVLPDVDPFLKLLKDEYYKNKSFDFIKSLTNFDGDEDSEVEPIKIENSYATFRVGQNKYYTVSLIGEGLMISAKWEDNDEKPIMANTLINRIFKK